MLVLTTITTIIQCAYLNTNSLGDSESSQTLVFNGSPNIRSNDNGDITSSKNATKRELNKIDIYIGNKDKKIKIPSSTSRQLGEYLHSNRYVIHQSPQYPFVQAAQLYQQPQKNPYEQLPQIGYQQYQQNLDYLQQIGNKQSYTKDYKIPLKPRIPKLVQVYEILGPQLLRRTHSKLNNIKNYYSLKSGGPNDYNKPNVAASTYKTLVKFKGATSNLEPDTFDAHEPTSFSVVENAFPKVNIGEIPQGTPDPESFINLKNGNENLLRPGNSIYSSGSQSKTDSLIKYLNPTEMTFSPRTNQNEPTMGESNSKAGLISSSKHGHVLQAVNMTSTDLTGNNLIDISKQTNNKNNDISILSRAEFNKGSATETTTRNEKTFNLVNDSKIGSINIPSSFENSDKVESLSNQKNFDNSQNQMSISSTPLTNIIGKHFSKPDASSEVTGSARVNQPNKGANQLSSNMLDPLFAKTSDLVNDVMEGAQLETLFKGGSANAKNLESSGQSTAMVASQEIHLNGASTLLNLTDPSTGLEKNLESFDIENESIKIPTSLEDSVEVKPLTNQNNSDKFQNQTSISSTPLTDIMGGLLAKPDGPSEITATVRVNHPDKASNHLSLNMFDPTFEKSSNLTNDVMKEPQLDTVLKDGLTTKLKNLEPSAKPFDKQATLTLGPQESHINGPSTLFNLTDPLKEININAESVGANIGFDNIPSSFNDSVKVKPLSNLKNFDNSHNQTSISSTPLTNVMEKLFGKSDVSSEVTGSARVNQTTKGANQLSSNMLDPMFAKTSNILDNDVMKGDQLESISKDGLTTNAKNLEPSAQSSHEQATLTLAPQKSHSHDPPTFSNLIDPLEEIKTNTESIGGNMASINIASSSKDSEKVEPLSNLNKSDDSQNQTNISPTPLTNIMGGLLTKPEDPSGITATVRVNQPNNGANRLSLNMFDPKFAKTSNLVNDVMKEAQLESISKNVLTTNAEKLEPSAKPSDQQANLTVAPQESQSNGPSTLFNVTDNSDESQNQTILSNPLTDIDDGLNHLPLNIFTSMFGETSNQINDSSLDLTNSLMIPHESSLEGVSILSNLTDPLSGLKKNSESVSSNNGSTKTPSSFVGSVIVRPLSNLTDEDNSQNQTIISSTPLTSIMGELVPKPDASPEITAAARVNQPNHLPLNIFTPILEKTTNVVKNVIEEAQLNTVSKHGVTTIPSRVSGTGRVNNSNKPANHLSLNFFTPMIQKTSNPVKDLIKGGQLDSFPKEGVNTNPKNLGTSGKSPDHQVSLKLVPQENPLTGPSTFFHHTDPLAGFKKNSDSTNSDNGSINIPISFDGSVKVRPLTNLNNSHNLENQTIISSTPLTNIMGELLTKPDGLSEITATARVNQPNKEPNHLSLKMLKPMFGKTNLVNDVINRGQVHTITKDGITTVPAKVNLVAGFEGQFGVPNFPI